jgi:hypothetical protein
VVNAIANVGAIIESEKPKASIAPKDLRRSANVSLSLDKSGHAKWRPLDRATPQAAFFTRLRLADYPRKPLVSYLD